MSGIPAHSSEYDCSSRSTRSVKSGRWMSQGWRGPGITSSRGSKPAVGSPSRMPCCSAASKSSGHFWQKELQSLERNHFRDIYHRPSLLPSYPKSKTEFSEIRRQHCAVHNLIVGLVASSRVLNFLHLSQSIPHQVAPSGSVGDIGCGRKRVLSLVVFRHAFGLDERLSNRSIGKVDRYDQYGKNEARPTGHHGGKMKMTVRVVTQILNYLAARYSEEYRYCLSTGSYLFS
jgi:hypothetical protein